MRLDKEFDKIQNKMPFHPIRGDAGAANGSGSGNYSGDDRDIRSSQYDRYETDLVDKPIFLLEHLATFTVNGESGILYPADGMRRLLQLEKTTGIWSQKMKLCLDRQWILIMDYETGVSNHFSFHTNSFDVFVVAGVFHMKYVLCM